VEVVASLSQGRTAATQCGLFTYKSFPVIFEPPCICRREWSRMRSSLQSVFMRNFLAISTQYCSSTSYSL